MAAEPAALRQLLASGRVVRAHTVAPAGAPSWNFGEVAGRVAEIGGTAPLTALVPIVVEAQRLGEPVAWVSGPGSVFLPVDVADCGVDLDALPVVRVDDDAGRWRAADVLLRSGAFGLVVLDAVDPARWPQSVQVRLANLARGHGAGLLCVVGGAARSGSPLASLRVEAVHARGERGRWRCALRATKDKRRGRAWETSFRCEPPPGLP